jgi:hypothetical protein
MRASRPRRTRTVSRVEYEKLLERIEDIEDVLHAREIERTTKPEDYLPVALVERMLAGEHAVRIWREHRGMSLRGLAAAARIPASYVSDIESRKKPGSVAAYKALAKALGVRVDDLVEKEG